MQKKILYLNLHGTDIGLERRAVRWLHKVQRQIMVENRNFSDVKNLKRTKCRRETKNAELGKDKNEHPRNLIYNIMKETKIEMIQLQNLWFDICGKWARTESRILDGRWRSSAFNEYCLEHWIPDLLYSTETINITRQQTVIHIVLDQFSEYGTSVLFEKVISP